MTSTRDRLLEAAEAVFGQLGYREATIQKIAEMAGANIAAVNYHFGDKARLCAAVIERELERRSAGAAMPTLGDQPEQAELQLERFVRWFVRRMVACGPGGVMVKLSQEMAAMGEVLDQLMELHIRRVHTALSEIVAALLPESTPADVLRRTCISILGLCVTYRHAQPIHARVYPELDLDGDELERIAAHSAAFSLAGVAAVRRDLLSAAVSGASAESAAGGGRGSAWPASQGFRQLGLVAERAQHAYEAAPDSQVPGPNGTDRKELADRAAPESLVTAADPAPTNKASGNPAGKAHSGTGKGRSRKAAQQPPLEDPRAAAGPGRNAGASRRRAPSAPGAGSGAGSKATSNDQRSSTGRSSTARPGNVDKRSGPASP